MTDKLRNATTHVRLATVGAAYLVAFIGLDWVSYLEPFGRFGITPWNPQSGLSLALVLLGGLRFAAFLTAAPLLADVAVRGLSAPIPVVALLSLATGFAYAAAAHVLTVRAVGFSVRLASLRDVLALLFAGAAGAIVVGCCYGLLLTAVGLIDATAAPAAILRYWVGDFIGIVVVAPCILLVSAGRLKLPTLMGWVRLAAVALALALIFAVPQSVPLQLLYILFLPIIWIALSAGLDDVCVALLFTQLGLVIGLQVSPQGQAPLLSYQLLMLVLAIAGLTMAAVVVDRRRAEQRVRLLQNAQARFNRLGSMGALSASLAHEINQPLSAAATFGKLAVEALSEAEPATEAARAYVERSATQVRRAAEIMRRVHDLILKGRNELQPTNIEEAMREAIELIGPEIQPFRIELKVAKSLPAVVADTLQIGQVVINLIHNAVEAMEEAGKTGGTVKIDVAQDPSGSIAVEVRDEGPGFDEAQIANPITAFASTKPTGLGVGLTLCESIIEAHGGKLKLQNWTGGACVRFTLQEASSGREIETPR